MDLSDDLPKELRVNVRGSIHEQIVKYIEFYEQAKGFKPDKNKVVDKGLEVFFASDDAFQSFLKNGGAKRGVSPANAAVRPAGAES